MKKFLIKTITTFFYLGYFPYFPGTLGSLIGLLFFYFLRENFYIYLVFCSFFLLLSFWSTREVEAIFRKKDPECVIVDEISGILISFFMVPAKTTFLWIGFFLFRIFDGIKPYPINKAQKLRGNFGIMLDDILAGFYTNICLQIVLRVISK